MKRFLLATKNLLIFVSGAIAATSISVAAQQIEKTINVSYRDIKIYADGNLVKTSAENEAFIYNGTTYLPVRAVSEALGKPINWDGNTSSVYIGGKNEPIYLEPYEMRSYKSYYDGNSFVVAGKKCTNGFTLSHTHLPGSCEYAIYNLNGDYQTFECELGHIDGSGGGDKTIIKFYLDGKVVKEVEITSDDYPQKISLPLNNCLQMKIELDSNLSVPSPTYGFYNVKFN